MRTACVGSGQQWIAAPAWMADREPVAKGSLPTSALSRTYSLHTHPMNISCCRSLHAEHVALSRSKQKWRSRRLDKQIVQQGMRHKTANAAAAGDGNVYMFLVAFLQNAQSMLMSQSSQRLSLICQCELHMTDIYKLSVRKQDCRW